jgi:hypothetical protein
MSGLRGLLLVLLVACDSPSVEVLVPHSDPAPDVTDDGDEDTGDSSDPGEPVIYSDCDSVWASAQPYDRCANLPDEGCPLEDECRLEVFYCESGLLFQYAEDKCPCQDDLECGPGYLCAGDHCLLCPDDQECDPCPDGHDYLMRNGCQTCECAPLGECEDDPSCGDGASCALGQRCADGCSRLDCCVNVCSDGSCAELAPEGCAMACERPECGGQCLAEACWCDADTGRWECKEGGCDLVGATCVYTP